MSLIYTDCRVIYVWLDVGKVIRDKRRIARARDLADDLEPLKCTPLSRQRGTLQDAYLKTGIVIDQDEDDAMHVALATLVRADVIASWNFKHLVNPSRIRAFSGVNTMQGYGPVVILTPADLNRILEESDEREDKDS